ncbi:MAG TPA: 8-amino-7-oxononanoate synthase [Steroidobacteraceae bacterium]|nr:8-amino-7-oxononanoate synthase [Steroidobacteraceae bacterium]
MSTGSYLDRYRLQLDELAAKGRLRALQGRSGRDFTSNDYLALSGSERLQAAVRAALDRGTGVGAGGSRLLRGNAPEHESLESLAATLFGSERALYFGSGYAANFAVLSTLPQAEDLLLLDTLAHASANEGARAGRARSLRVAHNDTAAFEHQLAAWRAQGATGRAWIAVESLYSMDGDFAPLQELMDLADRYEAILFIDEAHATGVYGTDGRGLAAAFEGRDNVLVLHTCSKALGGSGALVCGPRIFCDFLINRCRPFIYATAPSPLMAVAAQEALQILRDEPERRIELARRIDHAHRTADRLGIPTRGHSQIVPVIVGEDRAAVELAAELARQGFDVRAIRPPTVPEGTARLRIAITLHADLASIEHLFSMLHDAWPGTRPQDGHS